jgi:tetrahydromethanopterin S-methyltransferase subunit A
MEQERVAKLEAQVEGIKEDVKDLKADVKEVHSRITTGNREIMDKIESMESKLEQKMVDSADAAKKQHAEIQNNLQVDIKKVTDRVDVLERWRWMIVGGAIVLGYIIGHMDFFSQFIQK